jgi:catechol 2,3-dioxygenase-like lactoylglutathione lyase family enzyme
MFRDTHAFSSFSVDDLDKAREFYGTTLGLETTKQMALELKIAGGGIVFIYPKHDHEPASFTVLNFPVDDIDDAVKTLKERGVTFESYSGDIVTDENNVFRGSHKGMGPDIAWFKDPAGNILSVVRSPR